MKTLQVEEGPGSRGQVSSGVRGHGTQSGCCRMHLGIPGEQSW